jgi:hypothetical protein
MTQFFPPQLHFHCIARKRILIVCSRQVATNVRQVKGEGGSRRTKLRDKSKIAY